MADLRLQKQSTRFGEFADVTMSNLHSFKLSVGYSHASRLEFRVTCAAQHTLPFSFNDFLRFWDHGATHPTGGTQSSSAPLFEGFVEDINPGDDSNEVLIVCYDPTYRADKLIQVMGEPWEADEGNFPKPSEFALPRVVYNSTIDNDDDYALALMTGAKVGEIVETILGDHAKPLNYINASPGSGTIGGETQAWSDTETAELDTEPQGKFVAQSETIRSLVTRLVQQFQPAFKLLWTPGDRLWHFRDTLAGTARTITVNTKSGGTNHSAVLSMNLIRSTDGRYSAVEFYGPQDIEWREAIATLTFDDGLLTQGVGDTLQVITSDFVGVNGEATDVPCINSLQITDEDFTRVGRKGPYPINVPDGGLFFRDGNGAIVANIVTSYVQSWGPSLQMKFEDSPGGSSYWQALSGWYVDFRTGLITLGDACLYRLKAPPLGGDGQPELPIEVRFVYPALVEPLKVRHPKTGFAGTLASVAGIENVMRIYDEDLAVYRNFGQSVTTSTRLNRFKELAERYHQKMCDLVVGGGLMTNGLDYDFAQLNRRVNIAAKDDSGEAITTGWEAINAPVTDVEYDFEQMTTTLQVNSDELELIGIDPELLKQELNIRPAEVQFAFNFTNAVSQVKVTTAFGTQTLAPRQNIDSSVTMSFVDDKGGLQ